MKFSKDLNDARFDRLYKYDNLGRTGEARAGAAARGQWNEAANIPYKQNYNYNAFGNIVSSWMEHYAGGETSSDNTFTNNRNTLSSYDADGNETANENAIFQHDAAGRVIKTQAVDRTNTNQTIAPTLSRFDGAGQETKRIDGYVENSPNNAYRTSYFIRSSVTGKIVSEANAAGGKSKTFISANGATIAEQGWKWSGTSLEESVGFIHQDASGGSLRRTDEAGNAGRWDTEAEYDALGNNVGLFNPYSRAC